MDRQLELFDSPKCKIDKKIRLIELFGCRAGCLCAR